MPVSPRLPVRLGAAASLLAGLLACGGSSAVAPPPTTTTPPPVTYRYELAWSQEFDGPAGAPADTTQWVHDVGGGGWGNHELEYYTDSTHNASLDGAGHLVIEARRESFGGSAYTSARLKTQGRFAMAFGRFEARIRLPATSGIWPAFWMLGDNIATVGWPNCGELDILELIGKQPSTVYGTAHGGGANGHWSSGNSVSLPSGTFADDYHVFAVEWTPTSITWSLDSVAYNTVALGALQPGQSWPFDHPFFLLLNVAVGGDWPGNPDATATFPQRMVVDYVRVYRRVAN